MSFEKIFQTSYDESIYRNRLLLDHECPPTDFPFRKDEMDTIAGLINPILKNNKPTNGIIYGSCSTGKTTAIKKILEYLETQSKVVPVYINCELTESKREVYKKIIKKLKGVDINQNRIGTNDIHNSISNYLKNSKKGLIVVLDEADELFVNKKLKGIIKGLLKLHEEYYGVRVGIYIIVSDNIVCDLSSDLSSLLLPTEVFFRKYPKEQVYEILKKRCRLGFVQGAITENQIKEITNYSINIRVGLGILTELGDMAERDNSKKIKNEYLDKIINKLI